MHKFRLSKIVVAISLVFPSAMSLAEEGIELKQVVVSETKLPTEIKLSNPVSADSAALLLNQPGVSLYGAGGASSLPAVHGLADDRLRLKVDGMDYISSCPNHMNPPLSYVDPMQVNLVQVFSGIAPVSIGGDSIGASVLIQSNPPVFATSDKLLTDGALGVSIQSNNNAQAFTAQAHVATENLSVRYSGGSRSADNYHAGGEFKNYDSTGRNGQTLARDEVGSSAYKEQNHALDIAWKNGAHLFEGQLGYQEVPYQNYPNQRMDMLSNRQKRASLRYSGDYRWGKLAAQLWHERVSHYMNFGSDKQYMYGDAPGMPMNTKGKTTAATLQAEVPFSAKDTVKFGAEILHYTLDDWWPPSGTKGMAPNTFLNINNGQRNRHALFTEWTSRLNQSWQTIAGLRYEQVRSSADSVHGYNTTMPATNQVRDSSAFNASNRTQTDHNWDVSLLARYQADSQNEVEFGYAHKVRSPNLYERYGWSSWPMAAIMNNTVGDGNGYVGNVNLKPEQANTLSLTWHWRADGKMQFKATPYYTRVSHFIDAVKTASWTNKQFNVLRYDNQSAELYGIDLSGDITFAHNDWGKWGVKGLLAYVRGKNPDSGGDLYNIMPLNGKVSLLHQLGRWRNDLTFVAVADKRHVSEVRNELHTAGYGLLNLYSSYAWSKVQLNFGIENLFDRYYEQPLGGVYVGQGNTMSINSTAYNWHIPVPGPGRNFYAGVNIRF